MGTRKYDRGENRWKHVGTESFPVIENMGGEVVGKCPARMPDDHKAQLLAQAIPYLTVQPYSREFPKRLFVVDQDGTIYTGQTTDRGRSYHGYPYAGPLGRKLIEALRVQARDRGCEGEFDKWVKKHIKIDRKPDL